MTPAKPAMRCVTPEPMPATIDLPELLTVDEAARILRTSPKATRASQAQQRAAVPATVVLARPGATPYAPGSSPLLLRRGIVTVDLERAAGKGSRHCARARRREVRYEGWRAPEALARAVFVNGPSTRTFDE
jgi:hypothetical protein